MAPPDVVDDSDAPAADDTTAPPLDVAEDGTIGPDPGGPDTVDPDVGPVECETSVQCDDGDTCNGLETCDQLTGLCKDGTPLDCDDGVDCTVDTCDAVFGCAHETDYGACDDGIDCTVDTCNKTDGCKHLTSELLCDDDNPCTDDTCSAETGCLNAWNTAPCDDGNTCTSDDACVNGACSGTKTQVCEAPHPCLEASCDPSTGACALSPIAGCSAPLEPCLPGAVAGVGGCDEGVCHPTLNACVECLTRTDCKAGHACWDNYCVAIKTCMSDVFCDALGGVCDFSTPGFFYCVDCLAEADCPAGLSCVDRQCMKLVPCSSHAECDYVCDLDAGHCVRCLMDAHCPAGFRCDAGDCEPAICLDDSCGGPVWYDCGEGGAAYEPGIDCDDANACTADACDPEGGCLHDPSPLTGAECEDDDPCTYATTCMAGACVGDLYPVCSSESACPDIAVVASYDLDDGTWQGLTVKDSDGSDDVAVYVSDAESLSGPSSVYFGDPTCKTYYAGPLNEACEPTDPFGKGSKALDISLKLPNAAIPTGDPAFLGFWLRMAAEPAEVVDIGGELMQFDTDRLLVTVKAGADAPVTVWKSTDPQALGPDNTTGGAWRFMAADLTAYAGKTVEISFRFVTDATDNFQWSGEPWYGIYLDDITVQSTCVAAECSAAITDCPPDGDPCTSDTCSVFSTGVAGVCAYENGAPDEPCWSCSVPADCGDDPCLIYACTDDLCSAEPDPACCEQTVALPETGDFESFEASALEGWLIDDPYPGDAVTWQADDALASDGSWSLYFGDPATSTYEPTPANPARATAWTPLVGVPIGPFVTPILEYRLWMSTEYDGYGADPGAPFAFDTLTVSVDPLTGDAAQVWSSVTAVGNTTEGEWVQVAIDLSAFAGDPVRIGFAFDSGDDEGSSSANGYGGVRIDELRLVGVCEADCVADADCDDGNACTLGICDLGTCAHAYDPAVTATCCDEAPWLDAPTWGFETGASGFTTQDATPPAKWHLVTGEAASGTQSYNFSDPADGLYEVPGSTPQGKLITPAVAVPPFELGNPYAEFWLYLATEWDAVGAPFTPGTGKDLLSVKVLAGGPPMTMWTSEHLQGSTFGEWVKARVDLGLFRDQAIQLLFEFHAGDDADNAHAGPFVDDIGFATTCKPAGEVACIAGGDCPTPADPCQVATCTDDFACGSTPVAKPGCP